MSCKQEPLDCGTRRLRQVDLKQRGYKRAERVSQQIKSELMDLILRQRSEHADTLDIWISQVRVTDDLRLARVYLRVAGQALVDGVEGAELRARAVQEMQKRASRLRGQLGQRLQLKYTPELRFFWDEGWDHATRMEQLLTEIAEDEQT